MSKNRVFQGSILIIITMTLAFLSVIMYSSFRSLSYLISIAREREKGEYAYYAAYSLYRFVTVHGKNDLPKDITGTEKNIIFNGPWPDQESAYMGLVWAECKKNKKIMYVQLLEHKKVITTLSYIL